MNRFSMLLAAVLLLVSTSLAAAEEDRALRHRVKTAFTVDENIEGTVKSYINRELRSLKDVELVDTDPQWELRIVAMAIGPDDGDPVAVLFSVLVLDKFDNGIFSMFLDALHKKTVDVLTDLTANLYEVSAQWLRIGSAEDTRSICNAIVADFDTQFLEEARKTYRQMEEELKKERPSVEDAP